MLLLESVFIIDILVFDNILSLYFQIKKKKKAIRVGFGREEENDEQESDVQANVTQGGLATANASQPTLAPASNDHNLAESSASGPPVYSPEPPAEAEVEAPPAYCPTPPPQSLESSPEPHVKFSSQRMLEPQVGVAEVEGVDGHETDGEEVNLALHTTDSDGPVLSSDGVVDAETAVTMNESTEPVEESTTESETTPATASSAAVVTSESVESMGTVAESVDAEVAPVVEVSIESDPAVAPAMEHPGPNPVEPVDDTVESVEEVATTIADESTKAAVVTNTALSPEVNESVESIVETEMVVAPVVDEIIQSVITASKNSMHAVDVDIVAVVASAVASQLNDPHAAPAWFQAYVAEVSAQAAARHNELLRRIDNCNCISFNRLSSHDESAIQPLQDSRGSTPVPFPATRGALFRLSAEQCDSLLSVYDLSLAGSVDEKRSRLAVHIGLRL